MREIVPVLWQFTVRPQHAVDDFVADLHYVRQCAGLSKRGDSIPRVFEDGLDQLFVRLTVPSLWDRLLARIRPIIRVVVIEQKLESQLLGVLCERNRVFEIIGQLRRGVKQP